MQYPQSLVLVAILSAGLAVPELVAQIRSQPRPKVGQKRGRITLPPKRGAEPKSPRPVATRNDPGQFYRDVIDLRRSKTLGTKAREDLLRRLRAGYDEPAAMAIELSQRCQNDLLYGLMTVVDRYGTKYHVEDLHFQVLSRPLGRVTARVITTIVRKSGDRETAKTRLFDYLVCKYASARAAAVEMLPDYLTVADVPQLLQLSRRRKADIRRKTIALMGKVADPRLQQRLVAMMSQDPAVAAEACSALIAQGEPVVESLIGVLRRPARGKAFGYACFAMFQLESSLGRDLFTKDMVPALVEELRGDDAFLRAASAITLGSIAYRTDDWVAKNRHDKKIVDNLLTIVSPTAFVPSMRLLRSAATETLIKFTGHDFSSRREAWRSWWKVSRGDFVGLRRVLSVTPENAERTLLLWSAGPHFFAFRGPAVPDERLPKGARSFFLAAAEMMALIRDLRDQGFMAGSRLPRTPKVWTVDLRVDGARALMRLAAGGDGDGQGRGAQFHRTFVGVARAQLWQNQRDAADHPDAAAYWRSERKWLASHPGQADLRLVTRIIARLPKLDQAGRREALDDLQSVPELPKLITEIHGSDLVRTARALNDLDASDFRLLELAVLAPGETVWRRALAVLAGRLDGVGNRLATRLFRLLGPMRVLTAIKHPSEAIAVAAMHDAASTRHRAAVPMLLGRLMDSSSEVQRTAVYALGVLRAVQAREPLLQYEKTAPPVIRREIWAALGRIGGAQVPATLLRAMERPSDEDRLAAITAMGHTSSPELARFLAVRFVTRGDVPDGFSRRAELALRRMGALLAAPALRQHLQMEAGAARDELVLLLADMQEPMVVPDLIDFLRHPKHERVAARLISEITGVDLRAVDNRYGAMRVWYAVNKSLSLGHWFLNALKLRQVGTSLQPEHLGPRIGVAPVAELARLLVKVDQPYLRVLAAALLRETTGVDYTRGVRFAEASALTAIADRYRIHVEAVHAVNK